MLEFRATLIGSDRLHPNMKYTPDAIETWAIRNRYLFLSLGGLLLYVAFLGLRDVWYPGEPDMGEVALSMFNSGDWIAPRFMGEVWITYPPMMYWTAVIFSHLFGEMTAFALRLPNALSAIAIVLMVCAAGTRWFNARAGFWAGFALLISVTFTWQANGYRPDVLFTLGIAAGLLLYAVGTDHERGGWLKAAAFACLGFAMLAKGILGLLLPGLVLTLWLGARRQWAQIFMLAPLSLVSFAVFMPWVIGAAQAMGWESLIEEFYAQNLGRFASGSRGHHQPFSYYFKNFWVDLWPWAILFPWAVTWTIRSGLWRNPRVQLLLWWFGTFFIFLSFAETKRQLYLLPAYPAIVLILGPWLATVGRPDDENPSDTTVPGDKPVQVLSIIIAVLFGVLGVASLLFAAFFDAIVASQDLSEIRMEVANRLRIPVLLLGITVLTGAVWTGIAAIRRQTRSALVRTGLSQIATWTIALALVAPALQPAKSFGPQSRWIKEYVGPEQTHIGMVYPGMGERKRGGFAYEMGGTMVELLEDQTQVEQFFTEYPDSVVLINEVALDDIFKGDETNWQPRILRVLPVGSTYYTVVRGQPGD
jgi:4-amino-4-deoxy-L-arabinose transferase-like glycosyltransferase